MSKSSGIPVILFGYDSSVFTQKIQLALRMKHVPYTYIQVPSMMPRPILRDNFGITYRKIPVLSIGKEFYIDTSLIIEALELHFPASAGYHTLYPPTSSGRTYRPLIRGFASYWADRPLFRVTTGLIPSDVWRSSFGRDREELIGHKIDPDKLEKKVPQNLSALDLHLSILEPLFDGTSDSLPWIFDTAAPSYADIALYYQLDWGERIGRGEYLKNLTAGEIKEDQGEGTSVAFNKQRYPGIYRWFTRMKQYLESLPLAETRIEQGQDERIKALLEQLEALPLGEAPTLNTPASQLRELDDRNGLRIDAHISIAPDDTGRNDPTMGTIVTLNAEEIIIVPDPIDGKPPRLGELRVHFPRVGFVARPTHSKPTL